MAEQDYHAAAAKLNAPPEVADTVLAAVRLRHPLAEIGAHDRAWRVWECHRCEAKVFWRVGTSEISGSAAQRSCVDQIRHWQAMGLASEPMLAWLAEQEGASRG